MTDKRVPHPYACEECGRTFLGLAALQAHRCDKRVPRKPTLDMEKAAIAADWPRGEASHRQIWEAMLDAAPEDAPSKRISWSHVRMFEAMADKVRAGDSPEAVLADHGYVPVAERDALRAALRDVMRESDRDTDAYIRARALLAHE